MRDFFFFLIWILPKHLLSNRYLNSNQLLIWVNRLINDRYLGHWRRYCLTIKQGNSFYFPFQLLDSLLMGNNPFLSCVYNYSRPQDMN